MVFICIFAVTLLWEGDFPSFVLESPSSPVSSVAEHIYHQPIRGRWRELMGETTYRDKITVSYIIYFK